MVPHPLIDVLWPCICTLEGFRSVSSQSGALQRGVRRAPLQTVSNITINHGITNDRLTLSDA